jgi:hypothetical protein
MNELQLITFLIAQLQIRIDDLRSKPDRGDVAEKIVLIGIFVALAVTVGLLITKAVETNAHHLITQITGAP